MPPCRSSVSPSNGGAAAISATASVTQAAAWASGTRTLKRTTALSATTFRAPPPEIRATLTVTPSRRPFRACRRRRDDGGPGDGVAALVERPAGMGGLAGHDQMKVAAALSRPGQRPVGQRRLIGHADMAARPEFGQQRGRGGRADLLVGRQQHGPADLVPVGVCLERLEARPASRRCRPSCRRCRARSGPRPGGW